MAASALASLPQQARETPGAFLSTDGGGDTAECARKAAAEAYASLAQRGLGRRAQLATTGLHPEQVWLQIDEQASGALSIFRRHFCSAASSKPPSTPAADQEVEGADEEKEEQNEEAFEEQDSARLDHDAVDGEDQSMDEGDDGMMVDEEEVEEGKGNDRDGENYEDDAQVGRNSQPQTSFEDNFFRLSDMERFVRQAERKAEDEDQQGDQGDEDEDGEDEDYLENDEEVQRALVGDDVGGLDDPGYKYTDLFGEQSTLSTRRERRSEHSQLQSQQEAGRKRKLRTTHERVAEEVEEQARELEEENIGEKEWYMKGEAKAKERPKDSALEVDLEYDHAHIPAPEPSEEQTKSLEDLIKRRINDNEFDDVIRIPPQDEQRQSKSRNQVELDPEQSQKGLGEVYEEEYMRNSSGTFFAPRQDAERQLHDEARSVFKLLCAKLDAMSHLHVSPAAAGKSADTIESGKRNDTNEPALHAEEALPTMASAEARVTPEETYRDTGVQKYSTDKARGAQEDEKGGARSARKRARARAKRRARKRRDADEQQKAKRQCVQKAKDQAAKEAGLTPPSEKSAIKRQMETTKKGGKSSYTNATKVFEAMQKSEGSETGANAKKAVSSKKNADAAQLKL